MSRYRLLSLSTLTLCAISCAATTTTTPSSVLPLQRMRLYETGVGYFERTGSLAGADRVSLPVPSGHLDDALKTLVVLGGEQTVGQVAFESRLSPAVARARAGLPPGASDKIGFATVLSSLLGQRVELNDGARRVAGRLVDLTEEQIVRPRSELPTEPRVEGSDKSARSALSLIHI